MRYRVLGPLEVRDDERPLDLGSRKQRAVLALLLIEAGRVVSVDALIDGLWGESAPATAQGTLQAYISNLRKVLEPSRGRGEAPAVIVSRPPGYVLDVDPDAVDAGRFESLAIHGSELVDQGSPEGALTVLDEALSLWRGPAYADFAFEPFAQQEVGRLEELHLTVVEAKTESELALGRHRMLIGELRRWVEKEPLRERLRANLALALYRDARQAEALATLREGREYLADELGIDPGPELRDLEERMLRQDPALEWTSPPTPTADAGGDRGLVGRRPELEMLWRAAESARSGRGRVLLVAGDPGIGKTALIEEFSTSNHGLTIHWGQCYEGEGAPPFWPWRQILESVVAQASAAAVFDAAGERAADLVQLVPGLTAHAGDVSGDPVGDPEEARFRLYVAVASVITNLAKEQALMLVLDDLHWSDSASLRLLGFVAREIRQAGVLIVGTYRDAELGPDHPLASALASLARLPMVERVMLEGFDRDEVSSYVLSAVGSAPADDLLEELRTRTGGNPFFLSELLRLLKGERAAGRDEALQAISRVPANVRDVILTRVGALPVETQRVLEQAAVFGRSFDIEAVADLHDGDEGETLDALAPAVRSRLVTPVDPTTGGYRFSHALVRDAIYEELTPGIKARLHLRAGEVLERLWGRDPSHAALIASHFYNAGVLGAADKAVEFGNIAADHAVAQLAHEDAELEYSSALRFVDRMPPGRDRDVAELRLRHGLTNLLMMTRGYTSPEIGPALERIRELTGDYVAEGYAVIGVNIRGTGCSEGVFEAQNAGVWGRDGYEVVEWIARQPWSDGHVGMFGGSFPGLSQLVVAGFRPPHLDAIAPLHVATDFYRDVAYPGGIFNEVFMGAWGGAVQPESSVSGAAQQTSKGDTECPATFAGSFPDGYSGSMAVEGSQHHFIDRFWARTPDAFIDTVAVPTLGCHSWQDEQVGGRAAQIYLDRLPAATTWFIGVNGDHGQCLDPRLRELELDFFDHYLKGEDNEWQREPHGILLHEDGKLIYGGETPTPGDWMNHLPRWPYRPRPVTLFLREEGRLSLRAPTSEEAPDTYVYPAPSGSKEGAYGFEPHAAWKAQSAPGGSVSYTTPALVEDAEFFGPGSIDMWVATTAGDTDLQVTLTEVRPDGQELFVNRGWLRLSHRRLDRARSSRLRPVQTHLEKDAEPVVPNEPTYARVELFPFNHVFRKGSSIRLSIEAPTGLTGLMGFSFSAEPSMVSVLHDAAHPARISLGWIAGAAAPSPHPACDSLAGQPCRVNVTPVPSGRMRIR
ncbi:MAG: CocE/NonD family hydrolase [Actinomycetota bacterium]